MATDRRRDTQGTSRKLTQGIAQFDALKLPLEDVSAAFLVDRRAAGLAAGTLQFYRRKLDLLHGFCREAGVVEMGQLSADVLRRFQLWLIERGHNPGGQHAVYRTVRALLLWFDAEYEPDGWRNPIRRVKAPRVPAELLDPADVGDVGAIVATCDGRTLVGRRDRALLLFLLDTGARAGECLALDVADFDGATGRVAIRKGKGGKGRVVFVGRTTRRALRVYLAHHPGGPALWVTAEGDRLTYWGLRTMVQRRATVAGVDAPTLHAFRRAFALNCLRGGMDVRTLQRLMGHSSLAVLTRYLKLTDEDLRAAHLATSPVDGLDL